MRKTQARKSKRYIFKASQEFALSSTSGLQTSHFNVANPPTSYFIMAVESQLHPFKGRLWDRIIMKLIHIHLHPLVRRRLQVYPGLDLPSIRILQPQPHPSHSFPGLRIRSYLSQQQLMEISTLESHYKYIFQNCPCINCGSIDKNNNVK